MTKFLKMLPLLAMMLLVFWCTSTKQDLTPNPINSNSVDRVQQLVSTIAPSLGLTSEDVKADQLYRYDYDTQDWYEINWYSIERNEMSYDDYYNLAFSESRTFDGWFELAVWDWLMWYVVNYYSGDILCQSAVTWDGSSEDLDALISGEESDESDWDEFFKNAQYSISVSCAITPNQSSTSQIFFDGFWSEPFWHLYIRWNNLTFTTPESSINVSYPTWIKTENWYAFNAEEYEWSNIKWTIEKSECIDSSMWDTHDYSIIFTVDWDMVYQWCADEIDPVLYESQQWMLKSLMNITNYQPTIDVDIENASYVIYQWKKNYVDVSIYDGSETSRFVVLEKIYDWSWNVIYEWIPYEISDEDCESITKLDSDILDFYEFYYCPKG